MINSSNFTKNFELLLVHYFTEVFESNFCAVYCLNLIRGWWSFRFDRRFRVDRPFRKQCFDKERHVLLKIFKYFQTLFNSLKNCLKIYPRSDHLYRFAKVCDIFHVIMCVGFFWQKVVGP